ncbi:unnamed protein product [Rotaria socialis]|uniref:Uncharacterized protein n=1 Tax=Rotaria socialis TaxID=392032 RepID=A0A817QMJ7_9BILA|nr:unnamed protein product [Rotaria socialis]CAF3354911.1 unnamed protein product [Rotaria socialis]CAF3487831.1 unnamed protein product [Rotaria socialis]CAF4528592.1 unnamed protein product [Rotaria socialis]CAF4862331.1 unnamed protein product [Rotaria socialis]
MDSMKSSTTTETSSSQITTPITNDHVNILKLVQPSILTNGMTTISITSSTIKTRYLPKDDMTTQIIMKKLKRIIDNKNSQEITMNNDKETQTESLLSSSTISIHPYPPTNCVGQISDHDRPYAYYGHLDAKAIAREFQFNLETNEIITKYSIDNPRSVRMHRKSFAITCSTNVSKEEVMDEIKRIFTIEKLQYVCVAQEFDNNNTTNQTSRLHVQIILKQIINKKTWFLDSITGNRCNYQVTHNDRAWNEYIKKSLNYIEFGSFKSTAMRGIKYWPSQYQHKSS